MWQRRRWEGGETWAEQTARRQRFLRAAVQLAQSRSSPWRSHGEVAARRADGGALCASVIATRLAGGAARRGRSGKTKRRKGGTILLPGSSPAAGIRFCCRSEEHTSELQSLMRTSYAVFCLKKNTPKQTHNNCTT